MLADSADIEVSLLTGGIDKPYAFGLAMALMSRDIRLDFIGSDEIDSPELRARPSLNYLNLRGNQRPDASFGTKVRRILIYYARLIRYGALAKQKLFHILWNNKFETFDRTVLMLYYKALGKKLVLTAHNVNAGKRDSNDSLLNRLTLGIQYRLADHIFVHTESMKRELLVDFHVRDEAVTVIPLGINNAVPQTDLSSAEAKRRLGLANSDKAILFFGSISPYKGLEYAVTAFQQLSATSRDYRLIIAGRPGQGCEPYLEEVQKTIAAHASRDRVIQKIEFIPDEETELYFKAADVLALPYTHVFQSGVLVLAYSFGLPVIASDVGPLKEEVVDGTTGYLCRPRDAANVAETIERYFASNLFKNLSARRSQIRDYGRSRFSWDVVADRTRAVYTELLFQ